MREVEIEAFLVRVKWLLRSQNRHADQARNIATAQVLETVIQGIEDRDFTVDDFVHALVISAAAVTAVHMDVLGVERTTRDPHIQELARVFVQAAASYPTGGK